MISSAALGRLVAEPGRWLGLSEQAAAAFLPPVAAAGLASWPPVARESPSAMPGPEFGGPRELESSEAFPSSDSVARSLSIRSLHMKSRRLSGVFRTVHKMPLRPPV